MEKAYIRTERAHYMCPNMHFGIMARIRARYDAEKVRASLDVLQSAHPFLRSLIAEEPETGKLYYQVQERLTIPVFEKEDAASWRLDYDALAMRGWDLRRESMLRLICYPGAEDFSLLFMAQHLLCDGRGLLQLAQEFAEYYVHGLAPAYAEERLIASLNDLPKGADLPLLSRIVIDGANRRWDQEGKRVSYDAYLDFERRFVRDNPVRREVRSIEGAELAEIQAQCRRQGVSVNDWLIAKLMLDEDTEKVIIAADIRRKLACCRQGAMGNYSTAFSVVVKRKETEPFALAKQVSARVAAIQKRPKRELLVLACYLRMRPELLDAAPISALGGFDSASAAFVGGRMFGYAARQGHCVTNLGRIECDAIAEAVFIPPASPANSCIWGVLTVNGRMRICAAVSA